ncbi:MAG: hypothetical protein JW810_13735, partial [Sedimentisphaerales bacterium]|nr:hypothetical protein [Sedimentisphaerales bacterium]
MNHVKRTALLIITALASISYGFSGGDGSPENPYQIAEPNQLIYMSQNPGYWDKHIILTADINMAEISGVQFNAIGSETYPFSGVFEGDYHHIHNFNYENYTGIETFGLFGWIEGANAEVRNLSLIDANINVPNSGSWQGGIGILIGRLEQGEISQCHV